LSAHQFCKRREFPEHPDYLFNDIVDTKEHDPTVSGGGSVIISPLGKVLAGPNYESEGLVTADLGIYIHSSSLLYIHLRLSKMLTF